MLPKAAMGLLSVLVLLTLVVCSAQDSTSGHAFPEIAFQSDPALLGPVATYDTCGFALSPPRAWSPVGPAVMDTLRAALGQDVSDELLRLEPLGAFVEPAGAGVLSVARIVAPGRAMAPSELVEAYSRRVRSRFDTTAATQAQYSKDGLPIVQFLVQQGHTVVFKLLFATPAGQVVQVDYIVPTAAYPGAMKAIESSIGSIHVIRPPQERS